MLEPCAPTHRRAVLNTIADRMRTKYDTHMKTKGAADCIRASAMKKKATAALDYACASMDGQVASALLNTMLPLPMMSA